MRCGVNWYDVMGCDVEWCDMVWCDGLWCGVVWWGVVWSGMMWCGVMWCGVMWEVLQLLKCSLERSDATRYSSVLWVLHNRRYERADRLCSRNVTLPLSQNYDVQRQSAFFEIVKKPNITLPLNKAPALNGSFTLLQKSFVTKNIYYLLFSPDISVNIHMHMLERLLHSAGHIFSKCTFCDLV
jgi:hypothetical protein